MIDKIPSNVNLASIADEWLRIGLSTAPTDREQAQLAIAAAYRCAGLASPHVWLWLDSPLHGCIGSYMLTKVRNQVRNQVWDPVWAQVWAQVEAQVRNQVGAEVRDQVGSQVWAQVEAQVEAQVWDQVVSQVGSQVWAQVEAQVGSQVRDQVWAQVEAQVEAQVRDQVEAQVRAQVWDQVEDQVWDQVRDQMYRCLYGSHEAGWLSFNDTMVRIGVTGIEQLDGLLEVAKTCGWIWPFRNACIVTPRPSFLSRDSEGRLHCDMGPALDYNGHWGIWAWHGTRVPQRVIESPETLTVKEALAEQNTEVRRVMLTRIGSERLQAELPEKILDHDIDGKGQYRKLIALGDITDRRFVAYSCPSTGRFYPAQPVPPEIKTCAEAVAWRFSALDITDGRQTKNFDYQPILEG